MVYCTSLYKMVYCTSLYKMVYCTSLNKMVYCTSLYKMVYCASLYKMVYCTSLFKMVYCIYTSSIRRSGTMTLAQDTQLDLLATKAPATWLQQTPIAATPASPSVLITQIKWTTQSVLNV
jgi:hypothetical protein